MKIEQGKIVQNNPMYLTRWGDTGPRVIMVHGSAQGSSLGGDRHFVAQERLARQGWQIVVPDRPGHGRTPSPGRPDDAEADGRLVASLMDAGGVHLVGHSFGGCVALAAAAGNLKRIRSLTIIEPAMAALAMDIPVVKKFGLQIVKVLFFSLSARVERVHSLPGVALERNRDECAIRVRRMGSCPCKQPGRAIARFRSNPKGSGLCGRSAALRR